ncbi:MAG: hypothetical protein AUI14_10375 [Actinobacteria bacterium 13_2_20CM_2_71_6]|nr:MAG: hypothetical protein AUI14_10375 [Actinobacteria bacterium 13_2_20CM_2_71_6]
MPTRHLPHNPRLEHLRKHAKALLRGVHSGAPEALDLVREFHPRPDATADPAGFALADAQLVIARMYAFPSWPRLRAHLDVVSRYSRSPHHEPPGDDDLADRLLRLACLGYGADDVGRHAQARELLAGHPELAAANVYTAAAVGDVPAARTLLAADPAAANREGGPYRWPPLLYVAYSRLDSADPGHSTMDVARVLLEHGADPNAGYLWEGLPSPFTALTGAFGEGEDLVNQPRHRYAIPLARLLLEYGADPNDAQALYNRQFTPDNDHLELLLALGLGRGSGGPWRARLGPALGTPAQLVADQLLWAAKHNLTERVELLLRNGIDVNGAGTGHPFAAGRSAYELAVLHGNTAISTLLAAAGAVVPDLDPMEEFVAACMRADRDAVHALLAADPTLTERTVARRPDLVIRATELNRPDAIRLLAQLGFDVNARARITALHEAASGGRVALIQLLIELGADPLIRDTSFDATPLGWAEHNRQLEAAAFLRTKGVDA